VGSQRRLLIEEYNPMFIHLAGHNNVVADVLSCLELESNLPLDSRTDAAEIFASTSDVFHLLLILSILSALWP